MEQQTQEVRGSGILLVDGREVTQEEFDEIRESINSDPNKKLTKIDEGKYKTLQKLND